MLKKSFVFKGILVLSILIIIISFTQKSSFGLDTGSVSVSFKGIGSDLSNATLGKYIYKANTIYAGPIIFNEFVFINHFNASLSTSVGTYNIGTYRMNYDFTKRTTDDIHVNNWISYSTLGDVKITNDLGDGDIFYITDDLGVTGFKISLAGTDPSGIYVDFSNNIIYINTTVTTNPTIPLVHNLKNPYPSPPSVTFVFPDDQGSAQACLTIPELSINGNVIHASSSCIPGLTFKVYQGTYGFDMKNPKIKCLMKEKKTGFKSFNTRDGRTWDAGAWINTQILGGYITFTFSEHGEFGGECGAELWKAWITASAPGKDNQVFKVTTGTKCG